MKISVGLIQKASLGLAILLSSMYLIHYSQLLTRESGHWGIVYSKDNDSARSVGQMKWINWINVHSGSQYGPLHLRLGHLVLLFDPGIFTSSYRKQETVKETHYHFVLLMISLMTLCGLAGLLGFSVGGNTLERLVATLVFSWALLSSTTWVTSFLKAKPDILLSFLVGLGTFFTVKSQESDEKSKNAICIAAIFWGWAVATKLTAVLFLFPILFLFLPPFELKDLKRAVLFYLTAFASYLVVGLPQTLKFNEIYSFLTGPYQQLVSKAGWGEVKYYSIEFLNQLWFPALCVILLVFLFCKTKSREIKFTKRAAVLFLIPGFSFVYLLRLKWMTGMGHFYMPIVVSFLVILIPWIQLLFAKFPQKCSIFLTKASLPACVLILLFFTFGKPLSRVIAEPFENRTECDEEARRISNKISNLIRRGKYMVGDAYVPYEIDFVNQHDNARQWATYMEHLNQRVNFFATKSQHYKRYLVTEVGPTSGIYLDHGDDWIKYSKFYFLIAKKEPFKDMHGRTWELEDESPCGWEIWMPNKHDK